MKQTGLITLLTDEEPGSVTNISDVSFDSMPEHFVTTVLLFTVSDIGQQPYITNNNY